MSFLSSLASGPDYKYEERWIARIATAFLVMPFIAIAYGFGYAVGLGFGDEFPGDSAAVSTTLFVMLLSAMFFLQWFRGFRYTKRVR
jgi:hypothetical protein